MFGEIGLGKSIDLNLARWTSVVLNRTRRYFTPTGVEVMMTLRMVAIMNMKKLAGSGSANVEAISVQAWRDREFIRREVELIRPTIILTCGTPACRLFRWVVTDDELSAVTVDKMWRWARVPVFPVNHPSVRPKDAVAAFDQVTALVRKHQPNR